MSLLGGPSALPRTVDAWAAQYGATSATAIWAGAKVPLAGSLKPPAAAAVHTGVR